MLSGNSGNVRKNKENQVVLERRYCRGKFVKISGQWDECPVMIVGERAGK